MMKTFACLLSLAAMAVLVRCSVPAAGAKETRQDPKPVVGYEDTPFLPDGKWRVHDIKRPQPTVVTPGDASGKPPSDAIILFDGTDLSKWRTAKGDAAGWKVENGTMEVPPKGTSGGGNIFTREEFGDVQLHAEWAAPNPPQGDSQGRGNSGIYFFGKFEIQVLDGYENRTYADGITGALYGQYPPLVNACRKPGEWQVYDIVFIAPRFKEGKLESPAYITAFLNGVLVQNHAAYLGESRHRELATYKNLGPKGPILLQDHNHPVRYRNIWVRPVKGYDEP